MVSRFIRRFSHSAVNGGADAVSAPAPARRCAAPGQPALCQQNPPSPLARADVTASIGSFSAKRAEAEEYNDWTHSLFGGIGGGYYWSDHLKTEIDVASARPRRVYASEPAGVPESPLSSIFQEHAYQSVAVSVGQSYQFGRNALFHPFVTAGIDIERQRHEIERPAQSIAIYVAVP